MGEFLPMDLARCPRDDCPVWDQCARGRKPGDRRNYLWMEPGEVSPAGCEAFIPDPRLGECEVEVCRL